MLMIGLHGRFRWQSCLEVSPQIPEGIPEKGSTVTDPDAKKGAFYGNGDQPNSGRNMLSARPACAAGLVPQKIPDIQINDPFTDGIYARADRKVTNCGLKSHDDFTMVSNANFPDKPHSYFLTNVWSGNKPSPTFDRNEVPTSNQQVFPDGFVSNLDFSVNRSFGSVADGINTARNQWEGCCVPPPLPQLVDGGALPPMALPYHNCMKQLFETDNTAGSAAYIYFDKPVQRGLFKSMGQ